MRKVLIIFAFLLPVIAMAHPGHGVEEGHGLTHMLLSHGYLYILAILVLAGGYYFFVRENKR